MFLSTAPISPREEREAQLARTNRQVAEVEEIAQMGMRMLRAFERQVEVETCAIEAGEAKPDARSRAASAQAFARVARAVRLTQILERRLVGMDRPPAEAAAQVGGPVDPHAVRKKAHDTTERILRDLRVMTRRHDVRIFIERAIDVAERERGESFDRELAEYGAFEALNDPATPPAVWMWRPLGELAADICRELGVRYDPELWGEVGLPDRPMPDDEPPEDRGPRMARMYGAPDAMPKPLKDRFKRIQLSP
jgi:hypothetical protein